MAEKPQTLLDIDNSDLSSEFLGKLNELNVTHDMHRGGHEKVVTDLIEYAEGIADESLAATIAVSVIDVMRSVDRWYRAGAYDWIPAIHKQTTKAVETYRALSSLAQEEDPSELILMYRDPVLDVDGKDGGSLIYQYLVSPQGLVLNDFSKQDRRHPAGLLVGLAIGAESRIDSGRFDTHIQGKRGGSGNELFPFQRIGFEYYKLGQPVYLRAQSIKVPEFTFGRDQILDYGRSVIDWESRKQLGGQRRLSPAFGLYRAARWLKDQLAQQLFDEASVSGLLEYWQRNKREELGLSIATNLERFVKEGLDVKDLAEEEEWRYWSSFSDHPDELDVKKEDILEEAKKQASRLKIDSKYYHQLERFTELAMEQ